MPVLIIRSSGILAAPRDVVWGQLVDRESVPSWLDGIERLSGAGDRFATRRATQPPGQPIEGSVLEIERESRLRVALRGPWRLLREIDLALDLTPEDGGTRVSLTALYRLSWLGWLLRPLVRLRAEIAVHRASRGFRAAIDDALARRRHARMKRPGRGWATTSPSVIVHDALLRRTIPD